MSLAKGYWHRNPHWVAYLAPGYTWYVPRMGKTIFLTFDDGPVPGPTEFVLETLAHYGAKATFFCVGDNVRKHPELFAQLLLQGHAVGNHTFHHLNGWHTPTEDYLKNVAACAAVMDQHSLPAPGRPLFRPPYVKLKPTQARAIRSHYEIIMWDVLSADFDRAQDPHHCLDATIAATRPGSIVIFHDSVKAMPNLHLVLPRYLQHFAQRGYVFKSLWERPQHSPALP